MNPFALMFSRSGTIGRREWWFGQILLFVASLAIGLYALFVVEWVTHSQSLMQMIQTFANASHTAPDKERLVSLIQARAGGYPLHLIAILAMILALTWSSFTLDVKRWRDLGYSGFWVLTRFIPGFLNSAGLHTLGAFATLTVFLTRIFFLGCSEGNYAYSADVRYVPPAKDATKAKLGQAQKEPAFPMALMIIGGLSVVIGLGVVVAITGLITALVLYDANAPKTAALPVTPSVASAPAPSPDDLASKGTSAKNFAKEWVMVDNQKVSGITAVKAVPAYQVAIIFAEGARRAPANTLPQGFLDAWGITPQVLQAADAMH